MNPLVYGFTRCERHPSKFFTGFCSSCLLERLSAIDASSSLPEFPDLPSSGAEQHRNSRGCSERTTLISLFRLDDEADDTKHRIRKSEPESTSHGSSHGGECSKPKDISRFGSVFSKSFQKWRTRNYSLGKEERFRRSCDCKPSENSSKLPWEDPRHSWDGAMATRTLADEAEERDSDSSWPSERKFVSSSARTTDSSSSPFPCQSKKSLRRRLNEDRLHHHAARSEKPRGWIKIWRWSEDRSLSRSLRERGKTRGAEQRLCRSRSSYFCSPGNLDSGLLRFYLTPLRSSRRNTANRMNAASFKEGHEAGSGSRV